MRPQSAVIAMNIIADLLFYFRETPVASCWDPCRFKVSEEALHGAVVPTVSPATDTLCQAIPPDK